LDERARVTTGRALGLSEFSGALEVEVRVGTSALSIGFVSANEGFVEVFSGLSSSSSSIWGSGGGADLKE